MTALPFHSAEERAQFYATPTEVVRDIRTQPDGTFTLLVGRGQDQPAQTWDATFLSTDGAERPALLFRQSFVDDGGGFAQSVTAFEAARRDNMTMEMRDFMGAYYPSTKLCRSADVTA